MAISWCCQTRDDLRIECGSATGGIGRATGRDGKRRGPRRRRRHTRPVGGWLDHLAHDDRHAARAGGRIVARLGRSSAPRSHCAIHGALRRRTADCKGSCENEWPAQPSRLSRAVALRIRRPQRGRRVQGTLWADAGHRGLRIHGIPVGYLWANTGYPVSDSANRGCPASFMSLLQRDTPLVFCRHRSTDSGGRMVDGRGIRRGMGPMRGARGRKREPTRTQASTRSRRTRSGRVKNYGRCVRIAVC